MDIGFKDDIPDDFQTADGFAKIIDKHANHPSVIKIRENIETQQYFYFTAVNDKYTEKLMQRMDPKKAQDYDNIPSKLTISYWNLGLIYLEYTLWSLSWLSYLKF